MRRSFSEVLLILFVLFFEASQLYLCRNLTILLKLRDSFENCSRHFLAWEGKQCCTWRGVKCDAITDHVVKIDLSPKRFSMASPLSKENSWFFNCSCYVEEKLANGSFLVQCSLSCKAMSPSLLEFKHLNYLDLSFIDFQGSSIPVFLGSMKQLRYLNLSNSFFLGRVPHHLGNLTNLQILDLNMLDWSVLEDGKSLYMDDFTWVSHLFSLQYIDMSRVKIINEIDSLMEVILNLPLLLEAHFEFCGMNSSKSSHGFVNSSSLPSKLLVLNLAGSFLQAVPTALQNMTFLRSLDLSENFIDFVPLWLGKCEFLAHLALPMNRISGQFPTAVQNMSSLTFLDISENHIDSVPLWLGKFTFLAHLDLAWNNLTGFFPIAIQNISSLAFLDLSSNHLTSAIPLWFIMRVQHVILYNNKFSTLESSCPQNSKFNCNPKSLNFAPDNKFRGKTFGSLNNTSEFIESDIQELDLRDNELKASLESLGQLKNLMYLSLTSNFFYGPIPLSFRNMTKLQELILGDNQLNGTIPTFFEKMSNLRVLDLSVNHLVGVIPDNFGKLQNFRTLDLSWNHLSGIIPNNLWKLINLVSLDLSYNSFEGTIKEIHLDNLYRLHDLSLGMNKLSIELAPNWLPPFQLITLHFPSCKIGTPFPRWLRNQNILWMLDLSNTSIWGTFPTWFQQKRLQVLDLSNNKISGQLPRNLHDMMPNLASLFLGNNLLDGTIPESLCKLSWLSNLDLSKNKLSNDIPSCLGAVYHIELIDLSSNELSGAIPESLCGSYASYSLQSLNLSNNSLHGELPSTLQYCNNLEILDLGNNELYGVIPSSIWANSSVLKILRLRQNKFSGTIPMSLCQLLALQSLDLANNNLIGTIPFCLGNLKGMTLNLSSVLGSTTSRPANVHIPSPPQFPRHFEQWDKEDVKQVMKGREFDFSKNLKFAVNLDLSNNSLVGFLPEVLTSLTKLVSLNLSHNYLSGEIPSQIGKMKMLESLDISWNQLAGPLPSSMSSLTSLSHLNLSYNNFSGPIPKGNQFLTLEDSSIYVGNQYLCGEPVLKKCHSNDNNEAPTSVHHDEDKNEKEKILFHFVVAIGFMTGFWGIIALLVFNKKLRYVCFRYMEKIADGIYVTVAIRVARLKRMGLKNLRDKRLCCYYNV